MSMNAIPYASMGIGAFSSMFMSPYAQYKAGQAQKEAYEMDALIALEVMRQEEQASEQKYSALMGRQRSLYAKAGVDLSSGSPLLVLADTAMQEKIEHDRIEKAGTMKAEMLRKYGRTAASAGKLGAMTTFLTGLGRFGMDIYSMEKGLP